MVYWGMIVLPFCSVAVELIACLEHKNEGTWELFWKNSGYSYFFCWLFLGVVTAALCVIQIVRTEKFGYSEKVYRFADETHMQNSPSIRKRIIRRGKRTMIWPFRNESRKAYEKPLPEYADLDSNIRGQRLVCIMD